MCRWVVKGRGSGEAADGRSPSPMRSSGTFAAANGGFAALLMGSFWGGAGGGRFRFQRSRFLIMQIPDSDWKQVYVVN